jgi:thioredoxin reductase/bacterioferritin-associated ferredoxin
MSGAFDAIVIGAGPAGAEAAMTAAGCGRAVALIDEQPAAGGQVWRAPAASFAGPADAGSRAGDSLRRRLAASAVEQFPDHRVWSVTQMGDFPGGGFRVDALGPAGPCSFTAPALVAATGAHERVTPFPGWTLPGVIGLAAATVLLKSHGAAPGRRVLVAGCGPLLAAVAAGLAKAGVSVAAVADLSPRGAWLARLPAIAGRGRLALTGLGWALRAAAARIPLHSGCGVRRAEGDDAVRRVVIGPVDADGAPIDGPERAFDVDALIVGHGLTTACEITRLLRAQHRYDRLRGGWTPVLDGAFRTTVPGLYAIGDGAGVRGEAAATLAGRRAGVDLAVAGGALTAEDAAAQAHAVDRALAGLAPFSDAMAGLMAQRPGQVAAIAPDTVVCRCEDVTRREIDAAIDAGASEINQLKHFTRCGMGPCQGRFCGDTAQELMARRRGVSREDVGGWTARPPLRPVALADLIGDFSYDDIPIPEPAPL